MRAAIRRKSRHLVPASPLVGDGFSVPVSEKYALLTGAVVLGESRSAQWLEGIWDFHTRQLVSEPATGR